MKVFRVILSVPVVAWLFVSSAVSGGEPARPNFLIIMTDDMGYADPGCYGGAAETPRIDRLAKEGLRFTDFYCGAPNCSPSRAAMLTGRTPCRCGVYDWVPPNGPMCLPASEITIAEQLKQSGYRTGHFGKWHLARWKSNGAMIGPNPDEQGYDYWFGCDNNAMPSHLNPVNYHRNGNRVGTLEGYACDLVVAEAVDWLQSNDAVSSPFFVTVWFNEPHVKIASPPELVEKYLGKGFAPNKAEYLANVENIDRAVGKLLDAVDAKGFHDNTFVLFTSDNGPAPLGAVGPLRAGKSSIYEGGIRVPGIVRWPSHVKAGTETSIPAGFVDLLPTFCGLAGAELPKNRTLDGTNIRPLLEGKNFERTKPLFWFFYKSDPMAAIRDGDYKLCASAVPHFFSKSHPFDQTDYDFIKSSSMTRFELYDLKNDIGEKVDLSSQQPEIRDRLKEKLLTIHADAIAEGRSWDGLPKE